MALISKFQELNNFRLYLMYYEVSNCVSGRPFSKTTNIQEDLSKPDPKFLIDKCVKCNKKSRTVIESKIAPEG